MMHIWENTSFVILLAGVWSTVVTGKMNVAFNQSVWTGRDSDTCGYERSETTGNMSCPRLCPTRTSSPEPLLDLQAHCPNGMRDYNIKRQSYSIKFNSSAPSCKTSLFDENVLGISKEWTLSLWIYPILNPDREYRLFEIEGYTEVYIIKETGPGFFVRLKQNSNFRLSVHYPYASDNRSGDWMHIAMQVYGNTSDIFLGGSRLTSTQLYPPTGSSIPQLILGGGNFSGDATIFIEEAKWFNATLTNREIMQESGLGFPVPIGNISFPECRCPSSHPNYNDKKRKCTDNSNENDQVDRVHGFVIENINDNNDSSKWVSSQLENVSIELDLGREYLINSFQVNIEKWPDVLTIEHKVSELSDWKLWKVYSFNCTTGIPDSQCKRMIFNQDILDDVASASMTEVQKQNRKATRWIRLHFQNNAYVRSHFVVNEVQFYGECNCNGHNSSQCVPTPNYQCVCSASSHTMGHHCDLCDPKSYRMQKSSLLDECKECDCNQKGVKDVQQPCTPNGGMCICKTNVEGSMCDQCKLGYFGLEQSNPEGCQFCDCHPAGTIVNSTCDGFTGECQCKEAAGRQCEPFISAFPIKYGPQAGGTLINITGGFLEQVIPRLNGKNLTLSRRIGGSTILALTPSQLHTSHWKMELLYLHGANRISTITNRIFEYRNNPVITNIAIRKSISSGGLTINITGQHLNSVQYSHNLLMTDPLNGANDVAHIGLCGNVGDDDKVLLCVTPSVTASLKNSKDIKIYELSFIFDGYKKYRNLTEAFSDKPQWWYINVTKDPEIFPFKEDQRIKEFDPENQNSIEIEGKDLDLACKKEDFKIVIGDEYSKYASLCEVLELTSETITCLPGKQPILNPRGPDDSFEIHVIVGVGHLHFSPGYLKYTTSNLTSYIIGIVVGATLLLILIIVVATVCIKTRRKRPTTATNAPASYETPVPFTPPSTDSDMPMAPLPPTVPRDRNILDSLPDHLRQELQSCLINDQLLMLMKEIGKGHFGRVYVGRLKSDESSPYSKIVAVKTIRAIELDQTKLEAFLEEAVIMKDFDHLNVLSLYGVVIRNNEPHVILPYMENGDLKNYVKNEDNVLSIGDLLNFGLQIAKGMVYLSNRKFVHRDLAARNCMINKEYVVKIADFGLSRDIYLDETYIQQQQGKQLLPVKWMAIESLRDGKFSTKSDVWSFAILLWELLTRGCTPYPDVDNFDIKEYLSEGRRISQPAYCPSSVYEMMLQCMDENPARRPSFDDIMNTLASILRCSTDESYIHLQ